MILQIELVVKLLSIYERVLTVLNDHYFGYFEAQSFFALRMWRSFPLILHFGYFALNLIIDLSKLMSYRAETMICDSCHHEGSRHIVSLAQTRLVAMVTW